MIIVRLKGGMGNQMFQYAVGRAIALKNNTLLGLDTAFYDNPGTPLRTYDLDMFAINAKVLDQAQIPWIHRALGRGRIARILTKLRTKILSNKGTERLWGVFNSSLFDAGSTLYLDGYWQNPKYFENYEAVIRKDFVITSPLNEYIRALRDEISACSAVCVHIRRGDYIGNPLHDVVSPVYYMRAIAYLTAHTNIDRLYVFSDDIAWCKEVLTFDTLTVFVGEEYVGDRGIGHMALMQACTHFVIANSSFSWWAAWLGEKSGKVVVAPRQWFGDSSMHTEGLIPPAWVRL